VIDPKTLSDKAQELALDLGAESVIIIAVVPTADGWETGHGAYLADTDLTWEHVAQAVSDASEDILTNPILDAPVPS
jgi:hypothetical protein